MSSCGSLRFDHVIVLSTGRLRHVGQLNRFDQCAVLGPCPQAQTRGSKSVRRTGRAGRVLLGRDGLAITHHCLRGRTAPAVGANASDEVTRDEETARNLAYLDQAADGRISPKKKGSLDARKRCRDRAHVHIFREAALWIHKQTISEMAAKVPLADVRKLSMTVCVVSSAGHLLLYIH